MKGAGLMIKMTISSPQAMNLPTISLHAARRNERQHEGDEVLPHRWLNLLRTKPEPETTSIHGLYNEYDISIAERAATLAAVANGGLPPLVMIDSYAGFVAAGNGADLYKGDGLHLSSSGYALWGSWLGTALGATGDDLNCYLWRSGVCVIFAPTPYNLDGNGAGERRRVATTIMTAFVPSLAAMMMLC